MGDYVRRGSRRATVEVQRRARAPSGSGLRKDSGELKEIATEEVLMKLANTAPQENFDNKSCVIACGFPTGTQTAQVRNFFCWVGPVARVDNALSVGAETNFIVAFATEEHARAVLGIGKFYFDRKGTEILTAPTQRKQSMWEGFVEFSGFGQRSDSAPAAINEDADSRWMSSVVSSDTMRNMGEGFSHAAGTMGAAARDAFHTAAATVDGWRR